MRRGIKNVVVTALVMFAVFLSAGCGAADGTDAAGAPEKTESKENKPVIVCTGYPQYDWVQNILGDKADSWNVVRLGVSGADMHSFQPSAEDAVVIKESSLLIYTGGTSEAWIYDFISEEKKDENLYCLLKESRPLYIEEEDEHTHSGDAEDIHEEADEHIWMSPKRAMVFCKGITSRLCALDPDNSDVYEQNCEKYIKELQKLDDEYKALTDNNREGSDSSGRSIIVADRFPLRYTAADYGMEAFAAFPGCSAETEASFETMAYLSGKVRELRPKAVIVIEGSDGTLAETIIKNSGVDGVEIAEINSLQSVKEGEEKSYVAVMKENAQVLEKAIC